MRVLHSAALLRPPIGVVNQMKWEQLAARELGVDWDVKIFCPKNSIGQSDIAEYSSRVTTGDLERPASKLIAWGRLRREYYQWLRKLEGAYDAILLRYYVHDPMQLHFVTTAKKPVYLVHHSLEVPELASAGGIGGWARARAEQLIGRIAIRRSAGIIGVTKEIVEYEMRRADLKVARSVVYPNGVGYSGRTLPDRRTELPQFIFVASGFVDWHGLDLLLKEVQSCRRDFVLHLVGDVSSSDYDLASRDSRIRLHGKLAREEIENISSFCSVGLSSFALHRKRMEEACTLKVREYLEMGLPVYAGHRDIFPQDFKFYRNSGLNIERMIEYAEEMRGYSREQVSIAARPYIEKSDLLKSLGSFLRREVRQDSACFETQRRDESGAF